MQRAYENGNRLPVPDTVRSRHFLYQTAAIAGLDAEMSTVVAATTRLVEERGLSPAQIEVFTPRAYAQDAPEALEPLTKLFRAMGVDVPSSGAGVLVCEWAAPHVDESYEGSAFLSLVLHTGPEPYILQTFHSSVKEEFGVAQRLEVSTRVLQRGDLLILDPTTPHMAAPLHPHQDQFLVLLQVELPDRTPEDREAILKRFAPREGDRDSAEVFNGFGY